MIRLPPFELLQPHTLAEAAEQLSDCGAEEGESVRLVAGGTDLWPNMKRRHQKAETVVSLRGLGEMRRIEADDGDLVLGATATLSEIAAHDLVCERFPSFARAARGISTPALRNMGTLGGNLCLDTRCDYYNQSEEWRRAIDYCMKENGEVCWVAPSSSRCWAVSSGDCAPILQVLGARVRLQSRSGERMVPLEALYRDDGIDYLRKTPGEILVEVRLPAQSGQDNCRTSFLKLSRRGAIDFPVLSIAVCIWIDRFGRVEKSSIVLGAIASLPRSVPAAEESLVGETLNEERIEEAARLCRRAATPLDNTDFMAQWRSKMVEVFAAKALTECAQR